MREIELRRARVKAVRSGVRRGRVVDEPYLEWVREQICTLAWHDRVPCIGVITAHHVKETPGAPKNDRRAIPLCQGHHLHGFGMHSIERLGRDKWQAEFGIDLEKILRHLNERYEKETENEKRKYEKQ